jgi:hypothetical protein
VSRARIIPFPHAEAARLGRFPCCRPGSCVGAVMPPAAQAIWGQVTMEMAMAMVLAPCTYPSSTIQLARSGVSLIDGPRRPAIAARSLGLHHQYAIHRYPLVLFSFLILVLASSRPGNRFYAIFLCSTKLFLEHRRATWQYGQFTC